MDDLLYTWNNMCETIKQILFSFLLMAIQTYNSISYAATLFIVLQIKQPGHKIKNNGYGISKIIAFYSFPMFSYTLFVSQLPNLILVLIMVTTQVTVCMRRTSTTYCPISLLTLITPSRVSIMYP